MCIFNRKVEAVRATKILVARLENGSQLTVYQNTVALAASSSGNAMILPCPFKGEGEIKLVDLSTQDKLFSTCDAVFPVLTSLRQKESSRRQWSANAPSSNKLVVHTVGSYSISIAPSLADLHRIDESVFKVAANVDAILGKHYSEGFGFIICKFNEGKKMHPVAYIHPPHDEEGTLFVPTLHEHGGEEEETTADWDHAIFSLCCDANSGPTPAEHKLHLEEKHQSAISSGVSMVTWEKKNADQFLSEYAKLRELVPGLPEYFVLRRLEKKGDLPNEDTFFKTLPSFMGKEPSYEEAIAENEKTVAAFAATGGDTIDRNSGLRKEEVRSVEKHAKKDRCILG